MPTAVVVLFSCAVLQTSLDLSNSSARSLSLSALLSIAPYNNCKYHWLLPLLYWSDDGDGRQCFIVAGISVVVVALSVVVCKKQQHKKCERYHMVVLLVALFVCLSVVPQRCCCLQTT